MSMYGVRVSEGMAALLVVLLFSSSCTVTGTTKDFLSSTTPGDWYHGNGLIREEYKALAFVTVNSDNLVQNMTMGRGEYLSSMGELLGVPASREREFFAVAQQRSREFVLSESKKPDEILTVLRADWSAHAKDGAQVPAGRRVDKP